MNPAVLVSEPGAVGALLYCMPGVSSYLAVGFGVVVDAGFLVVVTSPETGPRVVLAVTVVRLS